MLGRIVEVLRCKSWDAVLRDRLFVPLGLEAAGTLPEEALLWGAATGHLGKDVVPTWGLPRSAGPAGLIHARALDLVAFARLHLSDGITANGHRLLSQTSAQAMRVPQVDVPETQLLGNSIGLAWILQDWGVPVFGHDGGTLGQNAFLRIVPGPQPLTVALLTNGGEMRELYQDLFDEILTEHSSATMPARLTPPVVTIEFDPARYIGDYVRESMTYQVTVDGADLKLAAIPSGVVATAMGGGQTIGPLIPCGPDTFLTTLPGISGYLPAKFYDAGGQR